MIYLDYKEIGQRIRAERTKHKYSQELLASKIGLSPQSVSFYEMGEVKPSLEAMLNICRVLGITLDQLVTIHYKGECR